MVDGGDGRSGKYDGLPLGDLRRHLAGHARLLLTAPCDAGTDAHHCSRQRQRGSEEGGVNVGERRGRMGEWVGGISSSRCALAPTMPTMTA